MSLETQIEAPAFEVIVVNDCPADDMHCLGFGSGWRTNWVCIQNERNLGRAGTRNVGWKAARGRYVLFLDNDIYAVPCLLAEHLRRQTELGGGVVIGAVPPASDVPATVWNRYIARRFGRIHERLNHLTDDYTLFLTGNVSVPVSALEEVGGFSEEFSKYSFEDTELGLRLHEKGYPFVYAPQAVGYHSYDENLTSIIRKAHEHGASSTIFSALHPEQKARIDHETLEMGQWWPNPGKKLTKIVLYRPISLSILTKTALLASRFGSYRMCELLLGYIELCARALGVRKTVRESATLKGVSQA